MKSSKIIIVDLKARRRRVKTLSLVVVSQLMIMFFVLLHRCVISIKENETKLHQQVVAPNSRVQ